MSQVRYRTKHDGKNIEVMAGWDPPLAHFFMTIFDLDAEDEEIIYSTINDFSKEDEVNTHRLEKKLFMMGIDTPDRFWETVKLREDGNTIRTIR